MQQEAESKGDFRGAWLAAAAALAILAAAPCPRALAEGHTYESKRTDALLKESNLQRAAAPEGQRIAWVRIVRDDVFVEEEVWPVWFNWFHRLSRDRMVRRELLFKPGDAFQDALAEETMRNLRGLGVLSLVRIEAVETEHPGEVGVLVHTRDLWSLRIEGSGTITTRIDNLNLRLVERNLGGMNKELSVDTTVVPDKYSLSQSFLSRRVLGSNVRLSQSIGVILGRLHSGLEGGAGGLEVSRPFYKLSQKFSYSASGYFNRQIARALGTDGKPLLWPRDMDGNAGTPEEGTAAYQVYDDRGSGASGAVAWRTGEKVKLTFGGGMTYRERLAKPIDETQLPDSLRDQFEQDVLPRSRRDIGPRLSYDMFLPRYRTFENLGSFGQSENIRVGPSVSLAAFLPRKALGSGVNAFVFAATAAGVMMAGKGGLLSASVSATSRLEHGEQIDQRLLSQLKGASPLLGPIRLVSRIALDARRADSQRTVVSLGSDRGLRGYQSRSFQGRGASRILGNFEIRTLPLTWRAFHVGGVLFYDVGSVYQRTADIQLHHAVGVGLRLFFPQFNRYPFSADLGMSVPDFRLVPTLTTSQVVPITDLEFDSFP